MNRDWLQLVGCVLVILGVGVWVLYGVGRYWMNWDVTDRQFIPYHLACVIPGMLLWQHGPFAVLSKNGGSVETISLLISE